MKNRDLLVLFLYPIFGVVAGISLRNIDWMILHVGNNLWWIYAIIDPSMWISYVMLVACFTLYTWQRKALGKSNLITVFFSLSSLYCLVFIILRISSAGILIKSILEVNGKLNK